MGEADVYAHMDEQEYFQRVISDLADRLDQRFEAQEKAIDRARENYEREHEKLVTRQDRIENQQAKLIGALILATLVLPLAVAGLTHLLST